MLRPDNEAGLCRTQEIALMHLRRRDNRRLEIVCPERLRMKIRPHQNLHL